MAIGSVHDTSAVSGTLDAYRNHFINRATAGWVAALGESQCGPDRPRPFVSSATALDRLEVRCQLIEKGDTAPGTSICAACGVRGLSFGAASLYARASYWHLRDSRTRAAPGIPRRSPVRGTIAVG
jgi:hypothetical protein